MIDSERVTDSSNTTGFERTHGFMPWDEFNNMVSAINGFGRAFLVNWNSFFINVQENTPQTERELLRWHASFFHTCLDVVNDRLHAVEQSQAQSPPPEPVPDFSGPETISIE